MSIVDMLQFGIFATILIAFVFVGCLATRARKQARGKKLALRDAEPRIAINIIKLPELLASN